MNFNVMATNVAKLFRFGMDRERLFERLLTHKFR